MKSQENRNNPTAAATVVLSEQIAENDSTKTEHIVQQLSKAGVAPSWN